MSVPFGAGTDPIGLDTAQFEFIDIDENESLEMNDIDDTDGNFLQGDARKEAQAINLQYYYKSTDWRTDAPALGATCSGYFVLARGSKRNQKGHQTLTVQVRRHKDVSLTDTQKET